MALVNKCDICGTIYEGGDCPKCTAEKEHSKKMNDQAVERIKKEILTQDEAQAIEKAFFEDDATITLRDNKKYRIPPCTLKDARKLMNLLKTVNIDIIVMNFVPTGDDELDAKREEDFIEIMKTAFKNYPEVDEDYIMEYVDVEIAKTIVNILLGINEIKK